MLNQQFQVNLARFDGIYYYYQGKLHSLGDKTTGHYNLGPRKSRDDKKKYTKDGI